MYKVYCDGIAIYDLFSPDLMLLEPTIELEINSPGSFTFTIPLDHPYYDLPQEMLSRVWVTKDDEEIFRGRVIEEDIDWYKRKKVYCEGELAFLNDSIQRPAEYHNMTVRDYFKTLIEEHNSQVEEDKQFEIGYVLVEDTNDSLYRYTNYNSTLTEMKEDLVDDLGGCIRVRNQDGHRYLDYITLDDYGARNDQAIRFGINLLDYTQTMDVSDIATVIIPLGERLEESPIEALDMRLTIESVNGGSDAIESEEAVKTFGRITKTVIWDDVTVASNLLEKGKKYLSDYQWDDMILKVTPVDLHDSDPDTESFNLGDELRVISAPHGLDRYFPLTAMTIHLDSLDQNTFTLGTEIKGKTLTGTIQTTINQVSEVENEITPTQIILNQAKEQATNLITAATHGHVVMQPNDSPEEILIMDTADTSTAKKLWRWNLNGLGYSSSGYNGTYGLAMTMDGAIVADYITTGTLTANIIKTGKIQDVPGTNSWDMDKGTMTISTKQFTLDSSGNATFSGKLSAATGTFAGSLSAATGTFAGSLSAATGTFAGSLSAASGTFSGNLSAAGGTFNGTVSSTSGDYEARITGAQYQLYYNGNRIGYLTSSSSTSTYTTHWLRLYANTSNAQGVEIGNYIYINQKGSGWDYSQAFCCLSTSRFTDNMFIGSGSVYFSSGTYSSSSAIYVVGGGFYVRGDIGCSGTKYRIVDTENYGKIGMSAFETASPMFSDIGSGTVGDDGQVSIYFSPEFIEIIDTNAEYQVFLTRTSQKQTEWVEKQDCYFIVHGEAGATFDWMVTAHQKDYTIDRFEAVIVDEDSEERTGT